MNLSNGYVYDTVTDYTGENGVRVVLKYGKDATAYAVWHGNRMIGGTYPPKTAVQQMALAAEKELLGE